MQNTHWILQHIKSCSTVWFRQSISWIQRFRLTQSHCHSLTQPHCHWDWQTESETNLMPQAQLSYHVCDLGLTALPFTCDIYPRKNMNDRKMGNVELNWPKLFHTFSHILTSFFVHIYRNSFNHSASVHVQIMHIDATYYWHLEHF